MKYTYRAAAERIRKRRQDRAALHQGNFPQERVLLRIESLLEDLVDLALRADSGTTEALRELEQEAER